MNKKCVLCSQIFCFCFQKRSEKNNHTHLKQCRQCLGKEKNIKSNLIERSVCWSVVLPLGLVYSRLDALNECEIDEKPFQTDWNKRRETKLYLCMHYMNKRNKTSRLHYLPIYLMTKRHKMWTHQITAPTTTINPTKYEQHHSVLLASIHWNTETAATNISFYRSVGVASLSDRSVCVSVAASQSHTNTPRTPHFAHTVSNENYRILMDGK